MVSWGFRHPARLVVLAWLSLPTANSLGASISEVVSATDQPRAPLDISKGVSEDSYRALSPEERHALLGEFKGLVFLGMKRAAYEKWSGKSMADCEKGPSSRTTYRPEDRWNYKCEVITGQGNGFYFFYPNESRDSSTLQRLDIRVNSKDESLLHDVRHTLQTLFGRPSHQERKFHWETTEDIADLFIDNPEGDSQKLIRFVWDRAPLTNNHQALNR